MFQKALKWPMISLAIAAVAHQITVIILPDLKPIFSPFTVGPLIVVPFGIVAGYKVVQFGGNYMHVMLVGILLSLVPWIAKIIFGSIGGAGVAEIVNESVFTMGMIFFGALIGGSFALSQ
jgi:hypothetical protein